MAEELLTSTSTSSGTLELAICQPDHPNQAVFVSDLNMTLQDFRTRISASALILPDGWVFMTRAGSLITTDQEESLQLNTIAREREEPRIFDVMVAPAISYQPPLGRTAGPGTSRLASFATIIGALRDVYVTSIQPNIHEFIKPMMLAAGFAAVFSFALALVLSLSFGALGGVSRSLLVPFLRHHLCSEQIETASQIPKLYHRINELETRLSHMRQVELGSLICKENSQVYEETETTTIFVQFRRTRFADTPRIIFSLRSLNVNDFSAVSLAELQVNSTGFTITCVYSGQWTRYNAEFSWVAVGK